MTAGGDVTQSSLCHLCKSFVLSLSDLVKREIFDFFLFLPKSIKVLLDSIQVVFHENIFNQYSERQGKIFYFLSHQ